MGQPITKELVIAMAIPLALGQVVGAVQGRESFTWFKILKKPVWCPPVPAFPIVWTTLYALMGYASYLVWQHGGIQAQQSAFLLYGVQLVLNLLWPIIFFKLQRLKLAQAENLVLLTAAVLTARRFYAIDLTAGRLFIPYILWLLLANALNLYIATNNYSADEDPRLEKLYDDEDKRNPGEQGYRPASASLSSVSARQTRGRVPLKVMAQGRISSQPIRKQRTSVPLARPRFSATAATSLRCTWAV